MTNIFPIIFLLSFFPKNEDVCTCPPTGNWQKATPKEYNYVNDVIIGDVINVSKDQFEIIVCTVFKGNLKPGQKINGENYGTCGPYINKTGEWLVFGQQFDGFRVNECGISSKIDDTFPLLPPPPKESETIKNLFSESRQKEAMEIRIKQISLLREMSQSR
ncbi:hypothetical protein [Nonlabens agnitus]|uniref:Uncharacterized protein n=1 Tax=Nonlabens agnitus TaxID=870484 RepID=A0A2S9WRJ8_9FLAO|nr:hypothetical protein [Nonlabens agnitus]PRP66085.1 hypothetical protein BST86_02775 [Nonlabens agnitus]